VPRLDPHGFAHRGCTSREFSSRSDRGVPRARSTGGSRGPVLSVSPRATSAPVTARSVVRSCSNNIAQTIGERLPSSDCPPIPVIPRNVRVDARSGRTHEPGTAPSEPTRLRHPPVDRGVSSSMCLDQAANTLAAFLAPARSSTGETRQPRHGRLHSVDCSLLVIEAATAQPQGVDYEKAVTTPAA